jgi:hypothetical protein
MSTALHDFACPACGFVARDIAVPIATGARAHLITCPACATYEDDKAGGTRRVAFHMDWLPQIGRMSAGHGPTFTAFETYDGRNRKVRVESIADLRRIERESEQQARNGEGQIMVWRDYSNDRSNKYDSAIHGSKWHDHPEAPTLPVRSEERIAQRQAAEGVENESVKHL